MGRVAERTRRISPLLGESLAIEELRDFIVGVRLLSDPVLLTGDPGTGKSLAASKIHAVGRTAQSPFVAVSCADSSAGEMERILFGGDGEDPRGGLVSASDQCTCYFAGIESMPARLMSRLRREVIESDLEGPRLIFGSRFSLVDLLEGNLLDPIFLEAISTFHKCIPPLRKRVEDIPVICRYQIWLHTSPEEYDLRCERFESEALSGLLTYPWPGNITELIEVVREYCGAENDPRARHEEGIDPLVDPKEYLRIQFERFYCDLLRTLESEAGCAEFLHLTEQDRGMLIGDDG